MSRKLNVKTTGSLKLTDREIETIFETEAKPSGNGAIIYVNKKYLRSRFYVVVCK